MNNKPALKLSPLNSVPKELKQIFLQYERREEIFEFETEEEASNFVKTCSEIFKSELKSHIGTWTDVRVPFSKPFMKKGLKYVDRILRVSNPHRTDRKEAGYFPTNKVVIKFVRY